MPPTLGFKEKATEPTAADVAKTLAGLGSHLGLDGRCALYEVTSSVKDGALAATRAEATKRILVQHGAKAENVSIVAASSDYYPPPRMTSIIARTAKGKWRCKPEPPKPSGSAGPPCPSPNTNCYLELADGTICNLYGVTNPTPENFPVSAP